MNSHSQGLNQRTNACWHFIGQSRGRGNWELDELCHTAIEIEAVEFQIAADFEELPCACRRGTRRMRLAGTPVTLLPTSSELSEPLDLDNLAREFMAERERCFCSRVRASNDVEI